MTILGVGVALFMFVFGIVLARYGYEVLSGMLPFADQPGEEVGAVIVGACCSIGAAVWLWKTLIRKQD